MSLNTISSLIQEPGLNIASFGEEAPNIYSRVIDLSTAKNDFLIETGASNFIWIRDATDNNANLDIKFNTQRHTGLNFTKGMLVKITPFSKIYIDNTAQAGKTITIIFGLQSPNFLIENPAGSFTSITGEVSITSPATFPTTADVTCGTGALTSLKAVNTSRKEIFITNTHASATVRIGDASTGASRGVPLYAGQTLVIENTAQFYCRNDSGGNVIIAVSESEV